MNCLSTIFILPALILFSCLSEQDKIDYRELAGKYQASGRISVKENYINLKIDFKEEDIELFEAYRKLVNIPVFIERYKDLKIIFINILDDSGKLRSVMTVKSENDHLVVRKGADLTYEPNLVLNLTKQDIIDLYDYFSDNKITEKEEFYLSNLFLIPSYESIFKNRDFIFFINVGLINFRTPVFMTLQNKKKYPLSSEKDNTKITLYNENGSYKIKKGHNGHACLSLNIDPSKTLKYYKIVLKILNENDLKKKIKLLKNTQYEFIKIYFFNL